MIARRTNPTAERFMKKKNATIDKDRVAIPVSLDWVTEMLQVPSNTELTAGLHNPAGKSEAGIQRARDKRKTSYSRPIQLEACEVCY